MHIVLSVDNDETVSSFRLKIAGNELKFTVKSTDQELERLLSTRGFKGSIITVQHDNNNIVTGYTVNIPDV